ncbi:MAG: CapA family protein [Spirochaetes bacterium]|nr:CapA family protein [Spirochaetota bacterium]
MKIKIYTVFFTLTLIYFVSGQKLTVSAVGDVMAHLDLQNYVLAQEKKYQLFFEHTKAIFLGDDLTFANLETPVNDHIPISGYPHFNAKTALVDAMSVCGIDIVSLANNHSYDQGKKGILSTIEAIEKNQLIYSGMARNPDDGKQMTIFEKNQIIIGYLSLTFSVNGLPYVEKKDSPFINLVRWDDQPKIDKYCKLIKEGKKNTDLVIVSFHCGMEYQSTPHALQEKAIKKMADAGADIILGHHPHVLQKIEYYYQKDGRKTLIAYSLGNYISAQARYLPYLKESANHQAPYLKTSESLVLQFDVVKWNQTIEITHVRVIPLFNITFPIKIKDQYYQGYSIFQISQIARDDPACVRLFSNPKIYQNLKEVVMKRNTIIKNFLKIENDPLKVTQK